MSWEDFEDMLTQTVTHYAKNGTDNHGRPTHSTSGSAIKCRIVGRSQRSFTVNEKTVQARYKLIMGTTSAISAEDKIALPAGYEPTTPPILGVYPVDDENGRRSHFEVWVGDG